MGVRTIRHGQFANGQPTDNTPVNIAFSYKFISLRKPNLIYPNLTKTNLTLYNLTKPNLFSKLKFSAHNVLHFLSINP